MKAFHNDQAIKDKYLARVRAHRAADELIRGTGWDGHRGCAIGCTLERYEHARYPIELGVPEQIAYLEDHLFERLPLDLSMAWPERVLSAIRVGADLSRVWPEFAIWMLTDQTRGVIQYAGDREDVRAAIERVAELYRHTNVGTEEAARAVVWAAEAAGTAEAAWAAEARAGAAWAAWAKWAKWAARSAAEAAGAAGAAAAAARAAAAAARAAALAAALETWSAAAAEAAAWSAGAAWIIAAADKLIAILEAA